MRIAPLLQRLVCVGVLLVAASPVHAVQGPRTRLGHAPATAERAERQREARAALATALDAADRLAPGDAALDRARTADLAWRLDPVWGRAVFERAADDARRDALSAAEDAGEAWRRFARVLTLFGRHDASRAATIALETARGSSNGASSARAETLAEIAFDVVAGDPRRAADLLRESLRAGGLTAAAIDLLAEFEPDDARAVLPVVLAQVASEPGPRCGRLLFVGARAGILAPDGSATLGRLESPEAASAWARLLARALDADAAEARQARAESRAASLDAREIAAVAGAREYLLAVFAAYAPEALAGARAAIDDIAAVRGPSPPSLPSPAATPRALCDEADATADVRRATSLRQRAAMIAVRDGQNPLRAEDARIIAAAIADAPTRELAQNDILLVAASEAVAAASWDAAAAALAGLSNPALRAEGYGDVALHAARSGQGDVARAFAASAARDAARAGAVPRAYGALVSSGLACHIAGDAVRAQELFADAARVYDRMGGTETANGASDLITFVQFGAVAMSPAIAPDPATLPTAELLARLVEDDRAGVALTIARVETPGRRADLLRAFAAVLADAA